MTVPPGPTSLILLIPPTNLPANNCLSSCFFFLLPFLLFPSSQFSSCLSSFCGPHSPPSLTSPTSVSFGSPSPTLTCSKTFSCSLSMSLPYLTLIYDGSLSLSLSVWSRGEALHMQCRGMYMEIHPLRWAQQTQEKAHWGTALPVFNMQQEFCKIWSPKAACKGPQRSPRIMNPSAHEEMCTAKRFSLLSLFPLNKLPYFPMPVASRCLIFISFLKHTEKIGIWVFI